MDIRFTIHNFMLMKHSIVEDNVNAKEFSSLVPDFNENKWFSKKSVL